LFEFQGRHQNKGVEKNGGDQEKELETDRKKSRSKKWVDNNKSTPPEKKGQKKVDKEKKFQQIGLDISKKGVENTVQSNQNVAVGMI
jgi:hypothetical protein